ncbi:hypothetical protein CDL12_09625 [Handroanthus impetiginosus]|uniref:Uncharacterized protein n=1 Tax=Handroanthus impetiginosus TaxID=429701 RepID=A0A2G9HJN1_9LAMI|nr:hypothetical protein CDL12_09625 [Handroanthus impetiginosus]
MSKNYNWERLVSAVLRREQDKELALNVSIDTSRIESPLSPASNFSYISTSSRFDHDINRDRSLVHRQRSKVPMDYSDLKLYHLDWKAILPPDKHEEIVLRSASLSIFVDQRTEKNCFILGAMNLLLSDKTFIVKGLCRWESKSHPRCRFQEVVELLDSSSWFYIRARIHAEMLSPETSYAVYLVFGLT